MIWTQNVCNEYAVSRHHIIRNLCYKIDTKHFIFLLKNKAIQLSIIMSFNSLLSSLKNQCHLIDFQSIVLGFGVLFSFLCLHVFVLIICEEIEDFAI